MLPQVTLILVIPVANEYNVNITNSKCHQKLCWCPSSMITLASMLNAIVHVGSEETDNVKVPHFMSRIHPANRNEVSVHSLICPLKLHQCYWYLLEANTMVYPRSLRPLAHQQPWWCPLFLLRSYLPQETMVMSLTYDCSCSVKHAMYKILSATRIVIDINSATL